MNIPVKDIYAGSCHPHAEICVANLSREFVGRWDRTTPQFCVVNTRGGTPAYRRGGSTNKSTIRLTLTECAFIE
jgi:hypothetical protein